MRSILVKYAAPGACFRVLATLFSTRAFSDRGETGYPGGKSKKHDAYLEPAHSFTRQVSENLPAADP